jgi:hypothetical protein
MGQLAPLARETRAFADDKGAGRQKSNPALRPGSTLGEFGAPLAAGRAVRRRLQLTTYSLSLLFDDAPQTVLVGKARIAA